MFRGFIFFLKFGWKSDKKYVVYNILNQFIRAMIPIVSVVVPKYILDELAGQQRFSVLAMYIGILVGYLLIAGSLSSWLSLQSFTLRIKVTADWGFFMHQKLVEADFENLENPQFLNLKEKANKFLYGDFHGFSYLFDSALSVMGQILTLAGILSIIATLNLWMVFLSIVLVLASTYVESRAKRKDMALSLEMVDVERGWNYYSELFENFQYGKEIRINSLSKWLLEKERDYAYRAVGCYRRRNNFHVKSGIFSSFMTFVQQIAAYMYLVVRVVRGNLTIGGFTLYISAITSFADAMRKVMAGIVEIRAYGIYYDAVVEYMNIPKKLRESGKEPLTLPPYEICFENVSFRYHGQKEYALKSVSFSIHAGEKLSIVGENGAGKTTLIKLLTRLYEPTEGRILLNGKDIRDYAYEEYMSLFSAVFQDYQLFAMSLYENVSMARGGDRKNIEKTLREAGLSVRLDSLSKGLNTHVYKIFDENGFEPSGGEGQKIAIARAIYKNAPIVILDEPTAALDPRAEYEIYQHFDELVQGKTALYISHRLSSARFCDRIIVLKDGYIIENGTHRELYAMENGVYHELYQMQAQFYED